MQKDPPDSGPVAPAGVFRPGFGGRGKGGAREGRQLARFGEIDYSAGLEKIDYERGQTRKIMENQKIRELLLGI